MSDGLVLLTILAAILTLLWAISLLVALWRIREALVDEDFSVIKQTVKGREVLIKASRVRGRFGATYQPKDGEPVAVEPKFNTRPALMAHIRKVLS